MGRSKPSFYVPIIFTVVVVIVAILFAPSRVFAFFRDSAERLVAGIASPPTHQLTTAGKMSSTKTPVYFLSHGGVSLMWPFGHCLSILLIFVTAKYHV